MTLASFKLLGSIESIINIQSIFLQFSSQKMSELSGESVFSLWANQQLFAHILERVKNASAASDANLAVRCDAPKS